MTEMKFIAIKAVGDWVVDITAVPFNDVDSDKQHFDDETDIMEGSFPNPPIFYHHGVEPGAKELQSRPEVIGKSLSVTKKPDGWHIIAILDKASKYAQRVWEAVKKGMVAVSSDSIAHLARLEVGGKVMHYEKSRAGRIAVWPLAGVSLWDRTKENFEPASRQAVALPAMKAIYRDAGIVFPELDTTGAKENAEALKKRTEIIEQSKRIIQRSKKWTS